METANEKIYSILQTLASEMGIKDVGFKVEFPKDKSNGDLASNIALVLSKNLNKPPFELANEISEKLQKLDDFEKVEAVKPGFINFYFSKKYLSNELKNIISQNSSYGSS